MIREVSSPHARGSILVAAVFRAFLNVYKAKTEDLFRIASNGSGILREGQIDPDLANRLATEAATIARRLLGICIRGMDYVPPVAVSFGDYLRAMITGDHDLYPEDVDGYRAAIVEAFSAWGIVPEGMKIVSQDTLLWQTMSEKLADLKAQRALGGEDVSIERIKGRLGELINSPKEVFKEFSGQLETHDKEHGQKFAEKVQSDYDRLSSQADEKVEEFRKLSGTKRKEESSDRAVDMAAMTLGMAHSREAEHHLRHYYARMIWMLTTSAITPELAKVLGITFDENAPLSIRRSKITKKPSLHVLPVRRAFRVGRRTEFRDEFIIEVVQTRYGFFDPGRQAEVDKNGLLAAQESNGDYDFKYRAGVTILVDAEKFDIRRLIRTPHSVDDDEGLNKLRAYLLNARSGVRNAFNDGEQGKDATAFADLHRHVSRVEEDW